MKGQAKSVYHSWSHSPLSFGNNLAVPSGTKVEVQKVEKQANTRVINCKTVV